MRWLVLVATLEAAVAGATPSVCVVELADPRAVAPATTLATLEAALSESFVLVPMKRLASEGRRLRLARSSWTSAPALAQLVEAAGCETPLRARLTSTRGQWTLSLSSLVKTTGAEGQTVSVLLGKPRLPPERARVLVTDLSTKLAVVSAPEPPAPKPVEPTPARTADDAAWSVSGFDTPAPAPSVTESIKLETTVEVGGRVAFEHYAFFENRDASLLGGRDNVEASLRLKAAHPRATVFASVLARADLADPSRNRFDPEEAWVELTFPHVSLKLGRLLVSTGTATLYNPSDVLNHFDLRDPLDPEKVGALMARAVATLGPVTLEAAVLPVPESHWFPDVTGVTPTGALLSRSRWVRGSVDVAGSVPVTYRLAPLKAQPPRPSNTQAFGRAEVSVLGADIGLGYGWLVDHIPSALVEAVPAAGLPTTAEVFVDWNYRRLHVITLDAERTFGKLRLVAEAAAFLTADLPAKNPRVADPYVIGVVGGDVQTPEFLGQQRVHVFLEFTMARALSGKLTLDGLDSFRYPFPLSVLGRVSWEFTDDLQVELNVFSSVERFDLLISPRVEYQFFDRVKLRVGADVMAGDRTKGFFGPWANNSRFLATVEASF